ncbi:MAG TPA: hypothetical protein V6D22_13675 [Candidatus Obscuribacterales bacterium]
MGFGGLFNEENALTNSANQFGLLAGQMQQNAANEQATALDNQANVAIQQTAQNVALQQRNIENAAGTQAEQYLSSGVEDVGTPIAVQNETNQLGQMQINSMLQQGQLQASLLRTQADYAQDQGLEAMLGARGSADINTLQNEVNQTQTKDQFMNSLIGGIVPGIVQGGFSILKGLI